MIRKWFLSRMFGASFVAILTILLCTFASTPATAQVTGATLSGTVTDPSGAVVAGAQVEIKNTGTGIVRTVTTDSAGLYSAPNLIPGVYEVKISAAGFSTTVQSNLTLSVGQQQSLNLALKLGEASQTVTVQESAPSVELTSATLSAQVNATTVRELPLNGRDWTQLATLQPGVNTVRTQASTSSPTTNRANRGFGNQLTDSGHSPYENSYRVNGININDYTNGSPGSVIGANLGTDAIQEFSVLTTDYTAEYGRTSGAVINSITKSGTNGLHGTAFGFLRNASLDAKNYFDPAGQSIPPFERYQYGGAIGGPIVKDKTFFFGAYEGVEQHRSNTTQVTVPDAAERALAVTQVQPYLGLWPVAPAGTPITAGGTQTFSTTGLLNLHESYATARVDHHFNDNDSLAGFWLFDRGPYTQPDALLDVTTSLLSYRQMYGLEETHVFSATLVNTARFGYNRSHGINGGVVGAINPIAADTTLGDRAGIPAPIITISSGGITSTSSVGSASQNLLVSNSFQFYDDAFWTKGSHAFKFGVAVERIQFNASTLQRPNGQFTFSTLQNFLNDQPLKVQELNPGNAFEVGSRNTALGFYVQDDWKAKSNLSLSIGLRYEPVTLPTEASNRFAVLTNLSPGTIGTELPSPVSTLWSHNASLKNFEPRVGFSWDPFKDGKTAVRGGFGMFDILPIPWTYTQTLPAQVPFTQQVTASGLTFPNNPATPGCPNGDFPVVCSQPFNASSLNVVYVPQSPGQAYAMNWNMNVQRQVTPSLTVTVGYVGSRSIHLPDLPDNINYQLPALTSAGYMFSPTSVGKLDTNVGGMRARLWDNDGWYHGLQVGVTENLTHGLRLQGSYTWSKCEDTGSNMAFNDPFQNSLPDYFYFDHRLTKGLCDFNISQNGVVSFIYNIPTIGSKSGFEAKILGGWQVGTIITVQSGSPFTPVIGGDPYNRAQGDTNQAYVDTVPGCNPINPNWKSAGANGMQYLNLNCFTVPSVASTSPVAAQCTPNSFSGAPTVAGQTYCANLIGNIGRNQISGPGLFDMDFSLFKNIKITERISTQFRVEMFNVLNHPSFLPPLDNEAIFNANGSIANNAGVVDATADDPRQIQFGLKVNF